MSRLRIFLLVLTIQIVGLFNAFSQSSILSWPLTNNFSTLTYSTTDLSSAAYTKGSGLNEDVVDAEGGHWWNFTTNSSLDVNDYLQIRLTPRTGGSAKNIYISSIEFSLRQKPWFTSNGPAKYDLYYSKASDFSNPVYLSSGDITTVFSSGDLTLSSPIAVYSGESIYFRLYGYESGGWGDLVLEDNQFFINGFVENQSNTNPLSSLSFSQNCNTDGNLIFDLPSGFNSNNQTILIFAKEGSAINFGSSTAALSAYPNVDNDLTSFSGSSYQHDANAKLVYKGTAAGPQALSGMSPGVDYYFVAFNFKNNGGSGNISAAIFTEGSVSGMLSEVSNYSALSLSKSVNLSAIAPDCVDAIMIVAKESTITGLPSGNGSAYTADPDYLGSGTAFDGGKVVYNSAHSGGSALAMTVSNLTNNTSYYFKAFVRKGTSWSEGVEITAIPKMAKIAFTQTQANGSDFFEFITLERQDLSVYNITDQGICDSKAIYRSFTEWEAENYFNAVGNADITSPLTDVPAGTFVRVYTGNFTPDIDYSDGLITLRNSNLDLSGSGDQVMVYKDPLPGPFADCSVASNPIEAGTNFADANDWITNGTPNDNTSYRPETNAAFATLNSSGRSRYNANTTGDSATILSVLVDPSNWQFANNNGNYWRLKRILFNQSDYQSGSMSFSTVSSNSFDLDASQLQFADATRSTRYIVVVRANGIPQNPVDRYTCYNVSNDYSLTDDVVRNVAINFTNNAADPCGTSQTLGNGKVVYFDYDLPSALTISGLSGCTTYQVAVYAVNGNGVSANVGTPLVDQLTTSTSGAPTSIYYSQQSGLFSTAIWDNVSAGAPSALPALSPCLKLVIQSGHTVTMDSDVSFGGLEIEPGGKLVLTTHSISLQRDLTINGLLESNTGKFILNGSDGQQILTTSSEVTFYDLEMDKASPNLSNELLVNGDVAVQHLLTIASGDLTIQSGNSLRLISDQADYAAALGPVPTSSVITGNFIVERYFQSILTDAASGAGAYGTGWRYVSSPVVGGSFNEINDDFFTGGLIGSDYPNWLVSGHYFPSIKKYDEQVPGLVDMGFDNDFFETIAGVNIPLAAPNIRNRRNMNIPSEVSMLNGEGVLIYISSLDYPSNMQVTLDWSGDVFYGSLNYNLSYTNHGLSSDDGWNLVGNPYPSAIDWRNVTRGAGVSNFIYLYDTEGAGNYVILDALAAMPQLIASSNAFWVQTSQAAAITFEESDKSLDVTAPFYKNADEAYNELYIQIHNTSDSILNDFTRLRFVDEASAQYDPMYDALKLYSQNPDVPGISTMIDTNDFAINSFHPADSLLAIPLKANIRTAGSYSFSFDMAGDYFDGMCMLLHDLLTDEQIIIEQNSVYSFESEVNAVGDSPRFEILFRPTVNLTTQGATCFNGNNGSISVETYGDGPFIYTIFDADGDEISSETGTNSYEVNNLTYGFYTLEVDGLEGECASVQREFMISQPAPSEAHSLISFGTECQGDQNGEIQVLLSDSLIYDLHLFQNNELLTSLNGISVEGYFSELYQGTYRVDVLSACDTLSYETTVNSVDSMQLDFSLSADTIYLQDGAEVYCTNNSENAVLYNWFFSEDQAEAITAENAEHSYTEAGTFEIYLFAQSRKGCQQYLSKEIVVVDLASSIESIDSEKGWTQVRYSNNEISLHFGNLSAPKTNLKILNELGQIIVNDEITTTSGSYEINAQQLQAGIYFIHLENSKGFSEVKRFVVK